MICDDLFRVLIAHCRFYSPSLGLGEVSDRFRESRTEITISGRLFQKPDGNSQLPDRFGKSCPAIGKVVRKSQKLSTFLKSWTETGKSGRKFSKSDSILDFRPTFSKVCF
jgi:hypothetical protein